jgi:SAM-dependent methyltransferase
VAQSTTKRGRRKRAVKEVWADGGAYEAEVGRWSRLVAAELVERLDLPVGSRWLDVGCGTGALVEAVARLGAPAEVVGVDPSKSYVAHARERMADRRVRLEVADAAKLPFEDASFDAVTSGLVLNFVPDPAKAAAEMARVVRPDGTVAAYVWDYADGMQLSRCFWDAAAALDPGAAQLDEGRRFPLCRPDALAELFGGAGLAEVETWAIEVPTVFSDFYDVWGPLLGGQGPGPGYVATLDEPARTRLRDRLRADLPIDPDGLIHLVARAWAVRGHRTQAAAGGSPPANS